MVAAHSPAHSQLDCFHCNTAKLEETVIFDLNFVETIISNYCSVLVGRYGSGSVLLENLRATKHDFLIQPGRTLVKHMVKHYRGFCVL